MKHYKKVKPIQKEKDSIKIVPQRDKPIIKESIRANIGLLGMKGKHLKSLMKEKTKERLT